MVVKRVHGLELNLLSTFLRTKPHHTMYPLCVFTDMVGSVAHFQPFTVLANAHYKVLKEEFNLDFLHHILPIT